MNGSWKKHIKPVLDSWEWDNYSWVWEPFTAKYPNFSNEQRTQVEDALVVTAFDNGNEKLAIKALSIAEALHMAPFATPRLSELFKSELRKQLEMLQVEREISNHYVFAFVTFGLKEAIPFLKSKIDSLEGAKLETLPAESKDLHRKLFRACCLSLLQLKDDDAISFFVRNLEYDLQIKALVPNLSSWGFVDLINFWRYIGMDGVKTITTSMQVWQKDRLALALPELIMVSEKIHYNNTEEKQVVKALIEDLQNRIAAT